MTRSSGDDFVFADGVRIGEHFPGGWDTTSQRILENGARHFALYGFYEISMVS